MNVLGAWQINEGLLFSAGELSMENHRNGRFGSEAAMDKTGGL